MYIGNEKKSSLMAANREITGGASDPEQKMKMIFEPFGRYVDQNVFRVKDLSAGAIQN
jgi:hypothetical protein